MHRIFISPKKFNDSTITITNKEEVHYIKDVLRLKKNSKIILFDGEGRLASATISHLTKSTMTTEINEIKEAPRPDKNITLACSIPKKSKFEFIIEKATELGVTTIIPLVTERTEIRISKEKQEGKLIRWKKIALSATRQSQRFFMPDITPITSFNNLVKESGKETLKLIPSLIGERKPLLEILPKSISDILILIGPEGDFTDEEYKHAFNNDCIPVDLGPNILRVETAALASLATIVQYYL